MDDLDAFLATVPAFGVLDAAERAALASRCVDVSLAAGERLLSQGDRNRSLFILRSGQVAVRAHQGDRLETIARLNPPAILGEISFLTGRPCSADVDVVVDARLVALSAEALASLPATHDRLVRGLTDVVADRLYDVVTTGGVAAQSLVIVLRPGAGWAAPRAFALAMARALAREVGADVLLVRIGGTADSTIAALEPFIALTAIAAGDRDRMRSEVASRLPDWTTQFAAVVLAPDPSLDASTLDALTPLASHVCVVVGPDDALPATPAANQAATAVRVVVAQDCRRPTLPVLDGTHRLIPDVTEAEDDHAAGRHPGDRFVAGVASLARAILDRQVGVVLGAGGARGWCHVGVLESLRAAGLPIDLIAGTSMGALVGGLWAGGASAADLSAAAAEWRGRSGRLREWRAWRMHMANERQLDALFTSYFGDRTVNSTVVPFWANAADIERGAEVWLRSGLLRQAARASMAFPGWTPPVVVDGRLLVDGAVVNPAPAQRAREMGAAFVVTVLAIGHYVEQPLAPRFPMRGFDLYARAFQLSGAAMGLARSARDSDVVVVPDLGDATMLSFSRDAELIAGGRVAAERQLPAILEAYARMKAARRSVSRSVTATQPS